MIHWPLTSLKNETWKAIEKIYEEEKVRAIGVCNFTIQHLKILLDNSSHIPSINQIEFSPFLYQKDLLEFCKAHNIMIEAHTPLTRGRKLNHPELVKISQKYNKSTAQILLRWGIQHKIIEIPRSENKKHIYENINIFSFNLDNIDIQRLNKLNENFRVSHDPTMVK